MLKNRDIHHKPKNHLDQTRDNSVISSSFPPKLIPTSTNLQLLWYPKKKTISLLCSPLMESEWPQTQTQNDYLILHLLLSLHPDCRIRLPSARLNSNNNNNKNNKGLRWEVCSDAGGCTVQDSAVCWPAFWGGHVDRLGSTPGRELNKSYEHCTWRWNS